MGHTNHPLFNIPQTEAVLYRRPITDSFRAKISVRRLHSAYLKSWVFSCQLSRVESRDLNLYVLSMDKDF